RFWPEAMLRVGAPPGAERAGAVRAGRKVWGRGSTGLVCESKIRHATRSESRGGPVPERPGPRRGGASRVGGQGMAGASATTAALGSAAPRGPSHHLELILARAVPTVQEIDQLWECLGELARSLAPLGRVWRLAPFGSVRNLLLTRGSDIDVTIYRSDAQDEGDMAVALRVLQGCLLPLLSQNPRFEIVRLVSGARIPILSLRFDGAVDVDLSCHNTEPLRNSQLLRAYAQASPLARGLVLLVKLWSKAAGVCGAQGGNLTSYSLALMVLYFLQVHPDFRLPVLSTRLFDGFWPPPATQPWECETPLPEALLQFFAFYSGEFEWGREVVSVRLGRRCGASGEEFASLPNATDNVHAQEALLLAALRAAEAALRGGGSPPGLGRAEGGSAAGPAAAGGSGGLREARPAGPPPGLFLS
ncbi:unnamed protein product, partial [Prorocentrum cordatum]